MSVINTLLLWYPTTVLSLSVAYYIRVRIQMYD